MLRENVVRLRRGLAIRAAGRLRPGVYSFAVGEDEPVLTVRASDAVIDCTDVVLRAGRFGGAYARGVGLRALNCERVEIIGLRTDGFQVGVHVLHSTDVILRNVVCERTRRIPLDDNGEPEPLLLFEKSGWRRYGTGIWVEKSSGGSLIGCTAAGAQNGITLDKATRVLAIGCDCARNSGWGIHLDRAASCRLVGNDCSECGRPGDQLSAGIAINNGCSGNEVVSNDLTRCGIGLLLTGAHNERSDDNLIASNDASGARTAGLYCTHSDRNRLVNNVVRDGPIGIGLVHARDTSLVGNVLEDLGDAGIVVQSGARVIVRGNRAARCRVAVIFRCPDGPGAPPADCRVVGNVLTGNGIAVRFDAGCQASIAGNWESGNKAFLVEGDQGPADAVAGGPPSPPPSPLPLRQAQGSGSGSPSPRGEGDGG